MAAAAAVPGDRTSSLRPGQVFLAAAAVCGAVLAVTGLPPTESLVTTYAATSATSRIAGLLAGISLLAAGALAAWFGTSRSAGVLLVGAGFLWFAPDWAGWEGGPPPVRGIATLVAPLLPVALWGLLRSITGGRRTKPEIAAVVIGGLSVGFVAVDDPFLDPLCWPTCSESALLVSSRPGLAEVLGHALALSWTAAGGVVLWCAVRRLSAMTSVARLWDGALLGALAIVGATELVYGIATLIGSETAEDPGFRALHLIRSAAWLTLAVSAAWATYRQWARRRALAALAAELEAAAMPGTLAGRLRSLTGDAGLDVWYPVDHAGRLVTADGRTVLTGIDSTRTTTALRRGEQVIAILAHDAVVLPLDALAAVLGAAARLALENERLAAERLARLHDLQESQRRIVVTGDEARRRLERDLHDGGQQSLLALSYLVRVALGAADRASDGHAVVELDGGLRHAQRALDDLRELAHGIHPAVLSQSGLAAALRSLAEQTTVPLELGTVTSERFDPSVELAAYVAVRDAATGADPGTTAELVVRAEHEEDWLVVDVAGLATALSAAAADRIGALGGRLVQTADGVRMELPCGS